ncbi:MAG: family 16 glycoside hydrolase [Planctomycetota bacterium]
MLSVASRLVGAPDARTLPIFALFFLFCVFCQVAPAFSQESGSSKATASEKPAIEPPADIRFEDTGGKWVPLTGHWETCRFGGDGDVEISADRIELKMGDPLTGVRWIGEYPRDNYEIELEARRIDGFDFFVAVTFPVADGKCSLVLGGWGGGVVGISSIDGSDAANNETTSYMDFKNGTWYPIKIRVVPEKIECFIDDGQWVDLERDGQEFDIRIEMDPALPLGFANFQCDSEIRKVRLRTLSTSSDSD